MSIKRQVERLEQCAEDMRDVRSPNIPVDFGPKFGVIRVSPKALDNLVKIYGRGSDEFREAT